MRPTWMALALLACAGTTTPGTPHSGETGTPPLTQEDVEAAIEAANTCVDASDCVDLGSQCPFGCWILVNAAEAEQVQATIDAYYAAGGSTCTYSCSNRGEIECRAGRCEADPEY